MAFTTGKLVTSVTASGLVSTGGADTISGAKDFTGAVSVTDAGLVIKDDADPTKQLKFQVFGIATGTTRTASFPNATGTVAYLDFGQTFTSGQTFAGAFNYFGSSTAAGETFVGHGATIGGATKTVRIGTGGVATSTTNITIGSSVAGALGATTINQATTFASTARLAGYTVATLPAAATAGARAMAFVTDATVVHAGNSGNIVAGGGANFCPVYSDGTNWRIL